MSSDVLLAVDILNNNSVDNDRCKQIINIYFLVMVWRRSLHRFQNFALNSEQIFPRILFDPLTMRRIIVLIAIKSVL